MPNPLLEMTGLPPFRDIRPEHVEPAVDTVLAENREQLARLLTRETDFTWDNLVEPLEEMEDRLHRVWAPVSHMNAVVNSEPLRQVYNACLPKLSTYETELAQNERLYEAFQRIAEGAEYQRLDTVQRKVIDNALRDFRLGGVNLDPDQKARFTTNEQRLATLTSRFDENLLDATFGWQKHIADEDMLTGLPSTAREMARQAAEREGKEGWLLTLEFPSYYAVMTHAVNRALRRECYEAYNTRASDRGPNAGKWDNTRVMDEILRLRHEQAKLLGFESYAHRSLATKMAKTPEEVLEFLRDLAAKSLKLARNELQEIASFALENDGIERLEAWDIAYYGEKLRERRFQISQEQVRPYFPADRVVQGLFEVVWRLYGLDIREVLGVQTWHEDVRFFEIYDNDDLLRGAFYLDLYARPGKRGGAWMDECVNRRRRPDGAIQMPVAFLTCNFSPPVGDRPALLTHDEVETLFHEFGHGLHHMLTLVDHTEVSGINGVPWDAVELPSQFLENWCWEREALDLFALHHETGQPLPEDLFRRMVEARNFQAGMKMVRQLEFALFDFRLYLEFNPERGPEIQRTLDEVRAEVAVVRPPEYNRFQHGFAHIFSGGYAAGYYSYKWAEVLASDAFSRFEAEGVFNRDTGLAFLETFLEQGGGRDPMELFVEFRGREPRIEALLRRSGIAL